MDEALQPINVQSAKQKMKSYSGNPLSLILAALVGPVSYTHLQSEE